jgi:hypothetical protein
MLCSNSVKAPIIWNSVWPPGVVVSTPCRCRDRSIFRACSSVRTKSCTNRVWLIFEAHWTAVRCLATSDTRSVRLALRRRASACRCRASCRIASQHHNSISRRARSNKMCQESAEALPCSDPGRWRHSDCTLTQGYLAE